MARKRKNATVHLEGAEELNQALRSISDRAGGHLLKEAAEAGAEVIRAEAQAQAPKDTGLLSQSLTDEPKRLQVGRAQIDIGPGKEAWYGQLLEKGTSKMPAKPFLRPAFDAKKDAAIEAVRNILRRLVDDW